MDFDLLIRGGTVVDGSGSAPVAADVGVRGDRIVAVGTLPDAAAEEVVDATGRVVSPGFIDVHVHSETALRGTARSGVRSSRASPPISRPRTASAGLPCARPER
jgi:N-acyl-D-amino-acid deacylase